MNRYFKKVAIGLLLCALILTGCGRSLIFTTGFRRGEVFRLGSRGCKIGDVRVYLLELQKQNEALYGDAIWESSDKEALQEAVKEQALAQVTRVKALGMIAVSRNVMLTKEEERLAEEAEQNYYASLSEQEIKYLGVDEKNLQRIFREYALAERSYNSLGDEAEQVYEEFYQNTQCDLNTKYWQSITLKKVEGDLEAPGFEACYRQVFPEAGESEETDGTGETEGTEESGESEETEESEQTEGAEEKSQQ
ncbi:MAG: hypothetical protein Q4D81_09830 [Eubacteriales bacterium]|nr:hypothetical protein [Eubacteriales bacterium]